MQQVCVWAPSNVGLREVTVKINEWMRCHPTKPPYERFIQDRLSSEWPVMWHLKSPFYVCIDRKERKVVEEENELENLFLTAKTEAKKYFGKESS